VSRLRERTCSNERPATLNGIWGAFVCGLLPTQSTTRWAQGCRPRSKQQVGFEKEDQDLVSALATAKNASCCPCAQRRLGIRYRYHPLPSSLPLARSLCDHTARSRLADGEVGRTPCVGFYGDRICGTSRSDRLMRFFPVSTRINSVANDDEACSAPVEFAPTQNQLFS
jgi:hypothetical protein